MVMDTVESPIAKAESNVGEQALFDKDDEFNEAVFPNAPSIKKRTPPSFTPTPDPVDEEHTANALWVVSYLRDRFI